VNVAGPGPIEPTASTESQKNATAASTPTSALSPQTLISKPEPPLPDEGDEDVASDDEAKVAKATIPTSNASDPYSGLDGAFANYLQDQPRPMGATNQQLIDDLLF
jgi:AP-2 complex subunit beta-1